MYCIPNLSLYHLVLYYGTSSPALYTGKNLPPFYFHPFALVVSELRLGGFHFSNYFSFNTIVSGQIQARMKPFASVKGQN